MVILDSGEILMLTVLCSISTYRNMYNNAQEDECKT